VGPFFIDQEAPPVPGGLPRVGALTVQLRNEHLQYALTWYGLAVVLAAVFTIWARGRRRAAEINP
jgi:cytochrome oxidase assembly protein ShyY1